MATLIILLSFAAPTPAFTNVTSSSPPTISNASFCLSTQSVGACWTNEEVSRKQAAGTFLWAHVMCYPACPLFSCTRTMNKLPWAFYVWTFITALRGQVSSAHRVSAIFLPLRHTKANKILRTHFHSFKFHSLSQCAVVVNMWRLFKFSQFKKQSQGKASISSKNVTCIHFKNIVVCKDVASRRQRSSWEIAYSLTPQQDPGRFSIRIKMESHRLEATLSEIFDWYLLLTCSFLLG